LWAAADLWARWGKGRMRRWLRSGSHMTPRWREQDSNSRSRCRQQPRRSIFLRKESVLLEVNRRATLLWLELSRERRWRGCAPRRSGCGRAPKSRSPRPAPRRRPGDEGGVEASVGLAGAHRSPAERATNPTLRSLVTGNPTQPPGAMPAPRRGLASSMRGSVERAHDSIVAAKPRGAASRQGRKAGAFSGAGRMFGRKHRAPDMAHLQPVSGVKLACRTVDKGGAAINLLFATQILCQSSAS
jgi:hypothetical protein